MIFESFDIAEEFFDGVFLFVESEELRDVGVQAVHLFEHVLHDFIRIPGFFSERLQEK